MNLSFIRNIYDESIPYELFGFNVYAPKKLNKSFFANINTHFSCFALENYELSEKYLIEKYLDRNDCVLELGGCLGVISLIINNVLTNKSNHVVFEIDKFKFSFLEKNRIVNKSRFITVNAAVSNHDNIYFKQSNNFWGGELTKNPVGTIRVKSMNMNNISKTFNLKFNTLIMDIEGGEIEIFENESLINFEKIIFENHYLNDVNKKLLIENNLHIIGFTKKDTHGKVEFWSK